MRAGEKVKIVFPVRSVTVTVSYDKSTGELTDSSLPKETEQEIEAIINSHPEISEPHNLRTRRIGNRIAIEAHVRLSGDMSLRDAHDVVTSIEHHLRARFGPHTIVTIHMEPEKP